MFNHVQTQLERSFSFGVVILAAGRSQRMGRPKLLLPWAGTSVLAHVIQQWQTRGAAQIAVVRRADDRELEEKTSKANAEISQIINPHPERGMFSSIQCAANWTGWKPEPTHWLITLGDQPHLRSETLRALLNFGAAHPEKICQPVRNGRRKHPVLLPKRVWVELKNSTASDLKQFLETRTSELAGFESDDAGLDLDMDTPEDYERLKTLSPRN